MNRQPPDAPVVPAQDRQSWSFRAGVVAGALGLVALAGIVLGLAMLFRPAGTDGTTTQERLAALQARAGQAEAQVQGLRGQLAASDADLAVERAARRTLEDNVAALQAQAGELRDRVAFYDQLLPAGPAGTLSIRAVSVARVPAGLRYRVLLMRSARPGLAPFVGSLRFVASGLRDGVEVRLPLAPLQTASGEPDRASGAPMPPSGSSPDAGTAISDPGKSSSAQAGGTTLPGGGQALAPDGTNAVAAASVLVPLEVDQYRSSEGILALPPDFTPTEVAVEVVQDGAVQASQQAAVAF